MLKFVNNQHFLFKMMKYLVDLFLGGVVNGKLGIDFH